MAERARKEAEAAAGGLPAYYWALLVLVVIASIILGVDEWWDPMP